MLLFDFLRLSTNFGIWIKVVMKFWFSFKHSVWEFDYSIWDAFTLAFLDPFIQVFSPGRTSSRKFRLVSKFRWSFLQSLRAFSFDTG